jgi:hypothetical protein
MEEYYKISNLQELMDYMNEHIEYGFVDTNGDRNVKTLKGLKEYYTTRSVEETINNGLGTCVEQALVIGDTFKRLGYVPYYYTRIFREVNRLFPENQPGDIRLHTFVLGTKDDKCIYFEHANSKMRGIYEYSSIDEALSAIDSMKNHPECFKTYQIDEIPVGISFNELLDFLISFDKEKTK